MAREYCDSLKQLHNHGKGSDQKVGGYHHQVIGLGKETKQFLSPPSGVNGRMGLARENSMAE